MRMALKCEDPLLMEILYKSKSWIHKFCWPVEAFEQNSLFYLSG
jgi:hypothetical protein